VSVEHICCDFQRECRHWRVRFQRLRWIWGLGFWKFGFWFAFAIVVGRRRWPEYWA